MLREIRRSLAMHALAVIRIDAIVDECGFKRFGKLAERTKIDVIPLRPLSIDNCEECVMEIVTPLRIEAVAACLARAHESGIVQIAFRNEDLALARCGFQRAHLGSELLQKVYGRPIHERVYSVEAQAVDV